MKIGTNMLVVTNDKGQSYRTITLTMAFVGFSYTQEKPEMTEEATDCLKVNISGSTRDNQPKISTYASVTARNDYASSSHLAYRVELMKKYEGVVQRYCDMGMDTGFASINAWHEANESAGFLLKDKNSEGKTTYRPMSMVEFIYYVQQEQSEVLRYMVESLQEKIERDLKRKDDEIATLKAELECFQPSGITKVE